MVNKVCFLFQVLNICKNINLNNNYQKYGSNIEQIGIMTKAKNMH